MQVYLIVINYNTSNQLESILKDQNKIHPEINNALNKQLKEMAQKKIRYKNEMQYQLFPQEKTKNTILNLQKIKQQHKEKFPKDKQRVQKIEELQFKYDKLLGGKEKQQQKTVPQVIQKGYSPATYQVQQTENVQMKKKYQPQQNTTELKNKMKQTQNIYSPQYQKKSDIGVDNSVLNQLLKYKQDQTQQLIKQLKKKKQQIKIGNKKIIVQQKNTIKSIDPLLPHKEGLNIQNPNQFTPSQSLLYTLTCQQVDQLKILSRLEPNSQIYNFRLGIYKQLQRKRLNIYEKIQNERMENIQFKILHMDEKQKRIHQLNNWIDNKRKKTIQQELQKYQKNIQNIYLHFIMAQMDQNLQIVKIVSGITINGKFQGDLYQTNQVSTLLHQNLYYAMFYPDNMQIMNNYQGNNVILTIQLQYLGQKKQDFISYGWTAIQIINKKNKILTGKYVLPLYEGPTQTPQNNNCFNQRQKLNAFLFVEISKKKMIEQVYLNQENLKKFKFPKKLIGSSQTNFNNQNVHYQEDQQKQKQQQQQQNLVQKSKYISKDSNEIKNKQVYQNIKQLKKLNYQQNKKNIPSNELNLRKYLNNEKNVFQDKTNLKGLAVKILKASKVNQTNLRVNICIIQERFKVIDQNYNYCQYITHQKQQHTQRTLQNYNFNQNYVLFYKQLLSYYFKVKKPLYLLVMLIKKNSIGQLVVIGWNYIKLINNNSILQGKIELQLFKGEIKFMPVNYSSLKKLQGKIELQLKQFDINEQVLNEYRNQRDPNYIQRTYFNNVNQNNQKIYIIKYPNSVYFNPVVKIKSTINYKMYQNNGINFYFDQVRFVIPIVTVLIAVIQIKDYKNNVIQKKKVFPQLNSSSLNQKFNYLFEIRQINYNEMYYIEISYITYLLKESKFSKIGFSIIKLFQSSNDSKEFSLITGAYSIPVYFNETRIKKILDQNVQNQKKWLCMMALIRIQEITLVDSKIMTLNKFKGNLQDAIKNRVYIPPTPYQIANYNHVLNQITNYQYQLFCYNLLVPKQTVKQKLFQISKKQKSSLNYKNQNNNKLIEIMQGIFKFQNTNIYQIQVQKVYPYVKEIGFWIKVDGLINIKKKVGFSAIIPFVITLPNFKKSNAFICHQFNYVKIIQQQSLISNPIFQDQPFRIHEENIPNKFMKFNLYNFKLKNQIPSISFEGWTVIPLFHQQRLLGGMYQLPFFSGTFPKDLSSMNTFQWLSEKIKNTSILIRLMDCHIQENRFNVQDLSKYKKNYLPKQKNYGIEKDDNKILDDIKFSNRQTGQYIKINLAGKLQQLIQQ